MRLQKYQVKFLREIILHHFTANCSNIIDRKEQLLFRYISRSLHYGKKKEKNLAIPSNLCVIYYQIYEVTKIRNESTVGTSNGASLTVNKLVQPRP